jgi:hypothetical protein
MSSLKIILLPVLLAAPLAAATPNLGFEEADWSGWGRLEGTPWKKTADAYEGAAALEYSAPAGMGVGQIVLVNVTSFKVEPGHGYEVSAFVKGAGQIGRYRQSVIVRFLDSGGSLLAEEELPAKVSSFVYDETRRRVVAPANATSAQVGAKLQVDKPLQEGAAMRFDSFSFLPAEEAARARQQKIEDLRKSYRQGKPPAPVPYDPEDKGSLTPGNLSVGKFYRFSRMPDPIYPDALPSRWSDGSKLTDEDKAKNDGGFAKDLYVGWLGGDPLEITVDLGRPQTLERTVIQGAVSFEASFVAPKGIEISTRLSESSDWEPFTKMEHTRVGPEATRPFEMALEGPPVQARYVRIQLLPGSTGTTARLLIAQIDLFGKIKNSWRHVPAKGAFHGAFPTANGFSKTERQGRSGMVVDLYEKLVGKKLGMVLWYQQLDSGRPFAEVQNLRLKYLGEDYYGHRFLTVGWLPWRPEQLKAIVEGGYDAFFAQYFADSVNPDILQGIDDPIWFRPMNEFNAGWVPYGLDPKRVRLGWRRMYNIAEQTGAAVHHIFVWSGNHRSYPDEVWNQVENYYPGDQYVDWVGLSAYPPSLKYVPMQPDRLYPIENVAEIYDQYAHYKPVMIAEGGYSEKVDRVRFVREWFEGLQHKRPNIKAVIWENHEQRTISLDEQALQLYRELVQSPYWLGETHGAPARPPATSGERDRVNLASQPKYGEDQRAKEE